jgi:hypothetical protein
MQILELSDKAQRLFLAAQRIADGTAGFFDIKGLGLDIIYVDRDEVVTPRQ